MSSPQSEISPSWRYRSFDSRHLDDIAARFSMPDEVLRAAKLVSLVLPFRVNDYVLTRLVDWRAVPEDPIFQMVFPQRGMLPEGDIDRLQKLTETGDRPQLGAAVRKIRSAMNPHPAGQLDLNVPVHDNVPLPGMQHKYRETVLYFPAHGQTCHAYCSYCFRWPQFVGDPDLRFAARRPDRLLGYLQVHPEVQDVLVTGGDPLMMSDERLRVHIEPLLSVGSVRTIRIGTKSVAYWPHRFVTDHDADGVLRLFERVIASGRTLALMVHFSHSRELETDIARRAVSRIRSTGALVYCQAPLIAHVNDHADLWTTLWTAELAVGAIPYYMFVERDTGPYDYFKVPLARAARIFHDAYRDLPGLARTVRGPVMSATAGKVVVDGTESVGEGRFFRLRFLQARDARMVGRPFRAHYSDTAAWLDELDLDLTGTPADIAAVVSGQCGPVA